MAQSVISTVGERRRERLREARLYLICEAERGGRRLNEWLGDAIDAGVDLVQLREKGCTGEEWVAVAGELRSICHDHGALFIVNDDPGLALAAGADGVHVGQGDMHPARVREDVGDALLIGRSTHSPDQIAAAGQIEAVDYIGVGPIHETPTKPGRAAVGLELVEHAAASSALPFFAIGGIDVANAPEVVAAGATRLAVVRAIADAEDPVAAVRALRQVLGGARGE